MKGLRRKFRRGLAGFLAFVLTMTSFNMVSWADVASAFETEKATFVMSGEEIRESAQAAIDSGNEFSFEDLGADASDRSLAKEYQRLFGAGTVFEFSPSYDMDEEEYADGAELRMFIRVDDAYEGYQITGDEDIIFLYINDSSARITFRSKIDGYTTQKVTVKGNSSLLDDNEAAVPGGEPQLPAGEEETNSDGAIETPDANGETNLEEETEASEPGKESESEEAIETPDTNEESESAEAIETSAADTETGETNENPDANTESNEDHSIQSPDPNTNAEENLNTETETDKSNEVQTPDENVSEDNQEPADHAAVEPASEGDSNIDTTTDDNTAAPSSDNSSDVEALSDDAGQLSVSRHSSYVLTTAITVIEENDSNDKAFDDDKNNKAAEVPADNQEKAEEFQNKETDPAEAADGEVNEETTIAAPVETESSNDAVSDEEEQTSVSSEEMIQVDNSIDNPVEKTEDNSENLSDEKESTVTVETSAEAEEQEEEKAVTGSTSGKTYGQIVLDESYYAKAYVTTLNKLHVDVSSEGYAVTYTVTPVGTATVKGAKNVAEGNDLSFTVKPQVGYVIDRVTANGEELEAVDDSEATDSNASLSAKRYIVPSVTEEQEIMISMSETGEHPEFSFSKTLGNVVVSLHAEEGILPAGTLAKVTEVTEKVQEAVKEKTAEETGEDTSENTVLAYDIKLFVENGEGELEALDNSWSENGYVDVTFSGRAIEEKSAEAETVEVEHIDTGNLDISSESVNKVAANEVKNIETVSDIIHVAGENTVAEISFEAAHFSVYMVTFKGINSPTLRFDLNNGKGTVPQPISAKAGELVTLPGQGNLYRDNYVLLGWSTSKDSSAVSKTSVSSYAGYVPLGSSYQMPWSSTTLYAVWAQNSGVKSGYLSIAIRNDGTIPGEPSVQYAGYAYLCENKKVDNLLYYFNPLHTVAGVEEVSNALTPEFYEEVERLNESKRLWNSNEYVEWYVIKDQRNDTNYPEGVWHIDGVVQKKISVSLNYNRNETPTGEDYGVVPDGQSYSKGQTAVIAGNGSLKWPGFTFDGWDTKKDGSGERYYEKDKIRMESNVTLYAQWQPNGAVKLTYDKDAADATEVLPSKIEFVQGGQSLKDKQKIIGSTSRPGYSFGGWYTEKKGSGNLFTVETPIETNMTVYANWIPNDEVTLTYDKAAEDAAAVLPNTTETVLRGQSLANAGRDIGITSRPGYKFGGWYTGKNGTGVPFDETVAIKENMTVYAKWTANAKVTLTYDKAAEDAAEVQPSATETVLSGQSLANAGKDLGITSRPGYTFGGWYTAENGNGQRFDTAYVIEESMTVYAKWTANAKVTLTYDKAAADAAEVLPNTTETVLSGQSLANAGKDLGITSRPGYTFGGWYTETEGSGSQFTETTAIAESMTVYAKWIPNANVTLTYDKDAEDASAVLPNATETVLSGQSLANAGKDLGITSRPGYTFGGWYTGKGGTGVQFTANTAIAGSMIVFAKWIPNDSVMVTYNKAAEDASDVVPNTTETVLSGQSLKDAGKVLGRTSRPGYTFEGWYTAENGGGKKFDEVFAINENMTVYAKWAANEKVTLTYDKAAEDAAAVMPNTEETVLSGQSLKDAGKGLGITSRPGYTFAGWYTEATGGRRFTQEDKITESMTVYARWTANNKVVLTYDKAAADASEVVPNTTETVLSGQSLTNAGKDLGRTSRPGYTFEGWYTEENGAGSEFTENVVLESDTTVYANWKIKKDLYKEINYYYDDIQAPLETIKSNSATFGELILQNITVQDEVTWVDGKHYALDKIIGKDKVVSENADDNIVNIYYALDEIGTGPDPDKPDQIPDKYQITFTYTADTNGKVEGRLKEVVTREKATDGSFSTTNPAYPEALVTATADSGYSFQNWTSSEVGEAAGKPVSTFASEADIKKAGFTTDSVFTAHFYAKDDTTYRVEYYYESQGKYPASTDSFEIRTGKTDASVSVTDNDKAKNGYVYDTTASNVESGIVKGDNSLVLKLYFKQQFTVTYQPGDHAFFTEQVIGGISYGDKTPEFTGEMNITGRYVFDGWKPSVAGTVTESAVYIAQWRYTGGSDGGGGGNTPNPNKPFVPEGPAGGTVTVEPGDVPLANLPEGGPTDNLILIDDGNVPLAGLPKTGDRAGAHAGLAALLSGFLLAAFTVLSNRKKEEEK